MREVGKVYSVTEAPYHPFLAVCYDQRDGEDLMIVVETTNDPLSKLVGSRDVVLCDPVDQGKNLTARGECTFRLTSNLDYKGMEPEPSRDLDNPRLVVVIKRKLHNAERGRIHHSPVDDKPEYDELMVQTQRAVSYFLTSQTHDNCVDEESENDCSEGQ